MPEQLSHKTDEILTNTNTNTEISLLANKKHASRKLACKVPLDTRIDPRWNDKNKELAQRWFGVGLRNRVTNRQGKEDSCLSAMADIIQEEGCAAVERILNKQQQPTITTTFSQGKKIERGNVKLKLIEIKEYLLKDHGGIYVKGESPTKFGLSKIRQAIRPFDLDPRTADKYLLRVTAGCGDAIAVGTRDSIFDLAHFFERDDLMPTKPKSKKNKNLGEFC